MVERRITLDEISAEVYKTIEQFEMKRPPFVEPEDINCGQSAFSNYSNKIDQAVTNIIKLFIGGNGTKQSYDGNPELVRKKGTLIEKVCSCGARRAVKAIFFWSADGKKRAIAVYCWKCDAITIFKQLRID